MIGTLLLGLYLMGVGVVTLIFIVTALLTIEEFFKFNSDNWSTNTKYIFIVGVLLLISYMVGLGAQFIS